MIKKVLLIGNYLNSTELNNILEYYTDNGNTVYINYSYLNQINKDSAKVNKQLVTWSFTDTKADYLIKDELFCVWPIIYPEVICREKYNTVFNKSLPVMKNYIKFARGFRDKNELYDLYVAKIMTITEIVYFNMKNMMSLFLPENQLRFRHQNMEFLKIVSRETVSFENSTLLYLKNSYALIDKIPFYEDFSNWLNNDRQCQIIMTLINTKAN